MNVVALKETLAYWISLALRKACTIKNITSDFASSSIIPFNRHAIDDQFGPSRTFVAATEEVVDIPQETVNQEEGRNKDGECNIENEGDDAPLENVPLLDDAEIAMDFAANPTAGPKHFFVGPEQSEGVKDDDLIGLELDDVEENSITQFLTLPTITARSNPRRRDPILDFTKSIILISEDYISPTRSKREAKVLAAQEKERNKLEKEETRKQKATER